ncbi:chaperone protein dnaJ C76, chloroplastic [Diospyros lotus]|uniref:chaperone protein dnaJ C76, chloroplastic n=1 Tax=Diospyros lotus TaxID=55363 RepID=UPI0022537A74|nr:chaperone protein dnaJ C76, chloroplastic [Diospyros lotus]
MHSASAGAGLLPLLPCPTIPNSKTTFSSAAYPSRTRLSTSLKCNASSSSSSSSIALTDLDLYDLLGVDSSSDHSQIKSAYRRLQKRCHPDVAGPAGHDMAIVLNQVYSLLSDPNSRSAYDKEQAKVAELRGYTGKPVYSVWLGPESEQRAVFVDEVKCVGCLKCALLAEKTFAVESVYGRARVVAQWADPQSTIQQAIEACPVDCISFVERSKLPALEFLMSKQPRGSVRVGVGNTVGTRVSNIFVDAGKFQDRFEETMRKASSRNSTKEARSSAVQAIRSISNWLYWQSPGARGQRADQTTKSLTLSEQKPVEPNISKLQEAAMARKHGRPITRIAFKSKDEYWIPSTLVLPQAKPTQENVSVSEAASESTASNHIYETKEKFNGQKENHDKRKNPFAWGIPVATATVAAAAVGLQVHEGVGGGLEEHVGGTLALGIVNSSWLPVILAGITWYLIATYMVELIQILQDRLGVYEK